jgi:hypothetical protein
LIRLQWKKKKTTAASPGLGGYNSDNPHRLPD